MIKKTAFSDMIEQIPSKQSDENLIEESVHVIWIGFKHGIPEVLPSKPFFNRRNVKCYRIADSTHENGRIILRGIPFEHYDFKRDKKLRLEIRVALSCHRNNVKKLALAVCKGENPEKSFLKNLDSWIKDYTRRIELLFIDQFDAEKEKLKQIIRQKALDEMGLTIDLDMKVSGSSKQELPEVKIVAFPVSMRDYSEEVNIELKIKTKRLDKSVQSILGDINTGDLTRTIKEKIEGYFLNDVTVYQLLYETNLLKERITEEIRPILHAKGLAPRKLDLKSKLEKPFESEFVKTLNHSFICKMTDKNRGNVRINQKITLSFQPNQVSKTLRHKLMDQNALENWVKTVSENTFTELLMQKEYYEITDFKKIKDTYIQNIEKHIEKIGFEATPQIHHELPDEDHNRNFNGPIEVKYKFVDREKCVLIKNVLDLTTNNMSEWMKLKQYNTITEWLEDSLRETFKEVLFSVKYSEYLLNRKHYHEQVKQIMSQKSSEIGYELKHIIVAPEEVLLDLLNYFDIDINDEFETNDGVEVPLKVKIQLCIDDDLSKVIHLIDAEPKRVIKNRINDEIKRTVLRVNAYYFYENFESHLDSEDSFKSTLKQNITNKLVTAFGAKKEIEVNTRLDRDKDDVIKRYKALEYEFGTIKFKLKPHQLSEDVEFIVQFEVKAIHGDTESWRRFIEKKYRLQDIEAQLTKVLDAHMKTLERKIYKYSRTDHYDALTEYIRNFLREKARESFGLVIDVQFIDRGSTSFEELRKQELMDRLNKRKNKALNNSKLLEASDSIKIDEWEHKKQLVSQINEQISELTLEGIASEEEVADKIKQKNEIMESMNVLQTNDDDSDVFDDITSDVSSEEAIQALKSLQGKVNQKKLKRGEDECLLIRDAGDDLITDSGVGDDEQ